MEQKYEIKCTDCGNKWKIVNFEHLKLKCPACSGRLGEDYEPFRWIFTNLDDEKDYFSWWKEDKNNRIRAQRR